MIPIEHILSEGSHGFPLREYAMKAGGKNTKEKYRDVKTVNDSTLPFRFLYYLF